MATLVELKEASFSHDTGPEILHQVSLSVQEGARIAVLGENGSGKSTLFRLLSGAWTPTSGELVIAGTPITRARHKKQARDFARAHVQLVLQEPDDQIFAMSVREDISFGPLNQGLTPEEVESRVDQAMMAAEVSELAEKVPHQLSYGQRKRVALAGALAMQPDVLMLDEPTAGLDPAGSRKLLRTIEGLEAAVVLSTHDVNLAYEFATDVVVLLDGRLTVGSCDHILSDTELLRKARLELPWAPVVSVALGRTVKRPEDVL
ncbi:ABC transporter ATP-binding protein [Corynebacterium durum]|uniref:energy-coupling factor ABC transporter ATP-binding protein n=1 Tax=Corynebacterium durum TaxID=61592 RepID=UPI0028ECF27A|nr:ABC transporter ATP-binding protein [Corynebacterium durum]